MEEEKKDLVEAKEPEKKRSWLSSKLINLLTSDDYKTTFNKIYNTMVIPMMQKLAVDAFRMLVYQGKSSNDIQGSYTPYDSYSDGLFRSSGGGSETYPSQPFKDIPFRTRAEAEAVLRALIDKLRKDRIISVADYYTMANVAPAPSYYNHGWSTLNGARVYGYRDAKGRDVWSISFPRTIHIETSN